MQSGHTGNRDMFNRGKPQRRQSEGNRTEKRLSAARIAQVWTAWEDISCEAVDTLFASTAAPPARIRSSLLLKTASSPPRKRMRAAADVLCYQCSISARDLSRQRS